MSFGYPKEQANCGLSVHFVMFLNLCCTSGISTDATYTDVRTPTLLHRSEIRAKSIPTRTHEGGVSGEENMSAPDEELMEL